MLTTAVEDSKTRADLAQLAGRGPFSAISMLAGVLVAYAAFSFLLAGVAAILRANGSQLDLSENWGDLSVRGGLLLGVLLFGAYLLAGYIAGRMAWRRGAAHGLLVFLGSVVVIAVAAAALRTFTQAEDVRGITEALASFGVPITAEEWGDVGPVVWVASLIGMVAGSVLGGLFGERWFTKVARRALEAEIDLRERLRASAERPAPVAVPPSEATPAPVPVREAVPVPVSGAAPSEPVAARADDNGHDRGEGAGDAVNGASEAKAAADGVEIDVDSMTKDELYQQAQELDIPGRSQMNKDELAAALQEQHDTLQKQ